MKRNILTLLALGASLLSGSTLLAQNNKAAPAAPTAATTQPPKGQKLVYVATITGVDANKEFQTNVQILQAQRQRVIELNAALEKEKDAKKKAELKAEADKALAMLNENNQKMEKAYGFTITRNYIMEIESARIYVQVTDEEAARIEKEAAEAAKAGKAGKTDTKAKK